jgi:tryptophan synthase beta chain
MTATRQLPDGAGHFEEFGGRFVPEALFAALAELEAEFRAASATASPPSSTA